MSIRQSVGGAQKVVTPARTKVSSTALGSARGWSNTTIVAPMVQGAKKLL